ncbi:MAG: hypothetical protein ACYCVH_14960 [Ignavibacteriaceae bacterium]
MNKGGFSWRRFVGISAAKARISRRIGIPLSRSGRYQKVGRMVTRGGCLVVLLIPVILIVAVVKGLILKGK